METMAPVVLTPPDRPEGDTISQLDYLDYKSARERYE